MLITTTEHIPGKEISGDFEYYIRVSALSGQEYFFPATAPGLNQAVVLDRKSVV